MEIKDDNWVFCSECNQVVYQFECCGNTSCNGGGCSLCADRTEIDRRIDAGEHPKKMEILPGLSDFLNEQSVWLAEEGWVDPTENRYHLAFGYQIIGFFRREDEEVAQTWVEEGGVFSKDDCWAILKDNIPKRRITQISRISPPIDPNELEDFLSGD